MNLESQVTSLELSKRLKELGVPQNSLFYYADRCVHRTSSNIGIYFKEMMDYEEDMEICTYEILCSAFTASELLEMLPVYTTGYNRLQIEKWDSDYIVKYDCARTYDKYMTGNLLAKSCAKMLAYLLENKLLELSA